MFCSFEQFFDTPSTDSASPQALGFEGFFRGAYSYHFHNFWYVIVLIIHILVADLLKLGGSPLTLPETGQTLVPDSLRQNEKHGARYGMESRRKKVKMKRVQKTIRKIESRMTVVTSTGLRC